MKIYNNSESLISNLSAILFATGFMALFMAIENICSLNNRHIKQKKRKIFVHMCITVM